jgi:hypothetical protein
MVFSPKQTNECFERTIFKETCVMDVPRFPPTIFDLVGSHSSQPQAPAKKGRTQKQSNDVRRPDPSFRDLVREDALFFRVVSGPHRTPPSHPAQGTTASLIAAVEEAFSKCFQSVWSRLPALERQRLLGYWRGEIGRVWNGDGFPPLQHRPVIEVYLDAAGEQLGWDWAATQLTFSAALVLDQPERLPLVIAHTLAVVHLFATRQYTSLLLEKFYGPLESWEQERGGDFTDAEYDAIQDTLGEEYQRAYEAEIMELLRRWNFGEPEPEPVEEPRRA